MIAYTDHKDERSGQIALLAQSKNLADIVHKLCDNYKAGDTFYIDRRLDIEILNVTDYLAKALHSKKRSERYRNLIRVNSSLISSEDYLHLLDSYTKRKKINNIIDQIRSLRKLLTRLYPEVFNDHFSDEESEKP